MTTTGYQAMSGIQGREYERDVCAGLERGGWTIDDRNARRTPANIEIDIVATDPDGVTYWLEAKGSWASNRNGGRRTDSIKKAVGDAAILSTYPESCPYVLVLSDLPKEGSHGDLMLRRAVDVGWISRVIRYEIGAIR